MITLIHAGLSQGELEALIKLLEPFGIEEQEEDLTDEYVSKIDLIIPMNYDREFFRRFGIDRWDDLKMLLKNIKWRRGKKRFRLALVFASNPSINFIMLARDDKIISKGLDTIEYLADSILLQLNAISIDSIKAVNYRFDVDDYRWSIDSIIDSDGYEYKYINGEWIRL